MGDTNDGYYPLFETKQAKGRFIYRAFAISIFVGLCAILIYRATNIPHQVEQGRFGWTLLFIAELWFTFYWILTQLLRWIPIYRCSFKHRLSNRYEKDLPKVDIFVCTADPTIEPPLMVINTILSVMAYDYPTEKLSIYLSDDGGSILTFYALLEASHFSKSWLPYCKKYNVEPRSPSAYYRSRPSPSDATHSNHLQSIKKLYEEMRNRIETATKLGRIPEDIRAQHKGFSLWDHNYYTSKHDHDTILQILIDGRNKGEIDVEGCQLPTLVYLSREKRPQYFHNFKAGAMNALLRVSSEISNGPIILNIDCDMYSNNSKSVRDALCFFMDEKMSQDIGFVQFPQKFENCTKNDIYGSALQSINDVEFHGFDGLGGPMYIGTGCFHQREILCGRKYSKEYKIDWKTQNNLNIEGKVHELEERAKSLANCTYELNSQWGKEMGLKYGCPVEDVITGLAIQCRGWKSVYLNPKRSGFLGLAATTLEDTLVQHKRWSEGDLQIMLSSHCPFLYGHKKINLGQQLGYSHYCFWAVNSLATLCYSTIPSLYLLRSIALFPELSSPWIIPFAYTIIAQNTYSLAEFLYNGGTTLGWLNEQRMWLYKRISSYLFALIDTLFKLLGFSEMKFVITNKVVDEEVSQRYENEIMEFGVSSPMFTLLTSLALINLFTIIVVLMKNVFLVREQGRTVFKRLILQVLLSGMLVLINFPLYKALFIRKDKGKMPRSVTVKALVVSIVIVFYFCLYG